MQKRIEYARRNGQKFVWVYRGEGKNDERFVTNSGSSVLNGTWFSESFLVAQRFVELSKTNGNTGQRIVACVVTEEMLSNRDEIDKGMKQINIVFVNEVSLREVTEPITGEPTSDDYLNQFVGYREFVEQQRERLFEREKIS